VDNNAFANWLDNQYLDWQKRQGRRRPAKAFAAYLGFENATVNQWLNGHRRPSLDNAFGLARRLGLGVYDALGLPRPDELLFRVEVDWDLLTQSEREKIGALLESARRRHAREARARLVRSAE